MLPDLRCLARSMALLYLVTVFSAYVIAPVAYARPLFGLENVTAWSWGSETEIAASASGDVDGDADVEIVTGGYYWDYVRTIAQLCVWDGSSLALEDVTAWYWISYTEINSLAIGDVDGDDQAEIVTGGYYDDETRSNAQLCVWNGADLALENVKTWYWTSHTEIESVALGDVDGDTEMEIVTGGYYYDGPLVNAQLCVWDGATLALENVKTWYWISYTRITSVAVGDVDADESTEIVTGGYYNDGTRYIAQLCIWDGSTLVLENVTAWYWVSHTQILSVAVGDVDGDYSNEIVTGGRYFNPSVYNAQLCVWSGASLAVENVKTWQWIGDTQIESVAVGDIDGDSQMEIVTGGYYDDETRLIAQLCVWISPSLTLEYLTTWYWIGTTAINSVVIEDVDGDAGVEIAAGGYYNDISVEYAQLTVWSAPPPG